MNKEELIGKLQMVYIGDINALNEMIGYYDGLKEVIEIVQQENKELHNKIDKAIEYNKQIIKDTKGFYRPTSDTIYSGDCLIDIAELNLKILKDSDVDE